MKPYKVFAVILPGLEELALQEMVELGVKKVEKKIGGLEFTCHPKTLYELNNMARIPTRFLVRVDNFKAKSFSEFEKKFLNVNLDAFLHTQTVDVKVTTKKSKLYHSGAIEERVLRFLKQKYKNLNSQENEQKVFIHAFQDEFTVSVDSSGESLYKRGVLKKKSNAPLRETIAAAMLRSSQINEDLWDPMCGTGTLPIEYLLSKEKKPIGSYRNFAFQNWNSFDDKKYSELIENLISNCVACDVTILGSDSDESMIDVTQDNLKNYSSDSKIDFFKSKIREIHQKVKDLKKSTFLVCNIPYGNRIKYNKAILKDLEEISLQNDNISLFTLMPSGFANEKWEILFKCKNGGISVIFCKFKIKM